MRLQRVVWTLSLCLLLAVYGNAQGRPASPAPQGTGASPPLRVGVSTGEDETQDRLAQEMAKKANLERQAALKADTEKLLKLATELKQSVDKTSASVLSVEVVKKAEEIEKLAHSVKDKMKGPN
ncbi:MAG TPA: hypothetical protein VN310_09045 [Candidatus Dormibacteraeota bacterium]|nr:hypothetical protein [Candidatus Dormibacteraeota bacterium]